MSDKLEDFIRSNRNEFDDKEPPEGAWENIRKTLPGSSSPWYDNLMLWRAAAVIFMVLSLYLLIPKSTQTTDSSKLAVTEFNDVEAFYTMEISEKVALIEEISGPETNDELTQDFQQLEAMYNVLKEEWKARPSKKVKEALVLNLLVRINLLNQQLHRLEQELEGDESDNAKESKASI
jgi:hypothetical protein